MSQEITDKKDKKEKEIKTPEKQLQEIDKIIEKVKIKYGWPVRREKCKKVKKYNRKKIAVCKWCGKHIINKQNKFICCGEKCEKAYKLSNHGFSEKYYMICYIGLGPKIFSLVLDIHFPTVLKPIIEGYLENNCICTKNKCSICDVIAMNKFINRDIYCCVDGCLQDGIYTFKYHENKLGYYCSDCFTRHDSIICNAELLL